MDICNELSNKIYTIGEWISEFQKQPYKKQILKQGSEVFRVILTKRRLKKALGVGYTTHFRAYILIFILQTLVA